MRTKSFLRFEIIILLAAIGLSVIGIMFIYSSAISSDGILQNNEYIKQIVWVSVGLVVLIGGSFFDYERLRSLSLYIYLTLIGLLLLVLVLGEVVNGAKSWLSLSGVGIQPSEFMKIALILQLATFLEASGSKYSDFVRFIISLIIMAIPMGLVLIQPDMGTAMVYIPIYLVMAFVGGIKKRYLIFILATGALVIIGTIIPAWDIFIVTEKSVKLAKVFSEPKLLLIIIGAAAAVFLLSGAGFIFLKKRYFYWIGFAALIIIVASGMTLGESNFIKDYQLKRLIIFMDPQVDPKGAGWNVIQSITAVGSGGPGGKGFLKGTQSHYRYLPQQSTDFIFSIIAEELGFAGCLLVFVLFLVILMRSLFILLSAKDYFALYIGSGVVAMIFFHFIVNIGMAMGIMPITGIPLLLVSYGGSSMLTTMTGLALVSSIYLHKYKY
ncbi:MAG: rod shape-determining protein RodA [Spirochaetales bacterium]|uniref:Peptidoglycan glycosyltransferase RodA n=1 Tax=Candidatus Thalassospirochaeta sargassi TaxID=3119039 RepID=A0AAJ1IAU0_9SPIO|nr:rod shape-determining protein RodA [Spirochaetales bacterium]